MNEPIHIVRGRAIPFDRADVDTDQIIPARHLRSIEREGFGRFAFEDWRARGDCPIDDPRFRGAPIMLTGPNFGCGSSREHAVWALHDLGLRVLVGPSFADIFRQNCTSVGILPVVLPADALSALLDRVRNDATTELVVDLPAERIATADGTLAYAFSVDPATKHRLLHGLDAIAATLGRADQIAAFERARSIHYPTTGAKP